MCNRAQTHTYTTHKSYAQMCVEGYTPHTHTHTHPNTPRHATTHTLIAVTIHYAKLLSLCQALCCALYKYCISAHEHGVLFLIYNMGKQAREQVDSPRLHSRQGQSKDV